VLTGEGADEALAGYIWFKGQDLRNKLMAKMGRSPLNVFRAIMLGMIGGGKERRADLRPMRGVRPAQQELYDMIGQARPILYTNGMWDRLEGSSPTPTWTSTTTASPGGPR
jgi:asparagine synthase (glutamine-hydrolysing)